MDLERLISQLISNNKASFVRVYDNRSRSFKDYGNIASLSFPGLVDCTFSTPEDGVFRLKQSKLTQGGSQGNSMGKTKGVYVVINSELALGLFRDCELNTKDRYLYVKNLNLEISHVCNSLNIGNIN